MPKRLWILISLAALALPLLAAQAEVAAATSDTFLISPTGIDFGQVLVGATSPRIAVAVRNVSNVPVTMNGSGGGTSSPFTGSTDCSGKTLLVDSVCHMYYRFKPSDLGAATGSTTGMWNGQNYTINLTGEGIPRYKISTTALDFGDVPVGTTAPSQTITITNVSAPVVASIAGGAAGQFGGQQDCQGRTLGTGQSCHFFYQFHPTVVGPASSSTSGSFNGQHFAFSFTGNGVPLPSGDYIPVKPLRVLDTRQFSTRPTAHQQLGFSGAGFTAAPTSAVALDLTVSVFPQAKDGTLTVWPCDAATPSRSTMRFSADTPISSRVFATFSSTGAVCAQATQSVDVVVDLDGYYSTTSSYHPVAVQRVADTTGGKLPAAGKVVHVVLPSGSVPAGSTAVALTLTALGETHAGRLTAYPCGGNAPNTSAVQYQAHRPQSALAVSQIGTNGQVCVRTSASSDIYADLVGYYSSTPAFTPIRPTHVFNTATHFHYSGPKPTANQVVHVSVTGGAVPSTASSMVLDVTASSAARAGELYVYSCGHAQPSSAALQFTANRTVTTLTISGIISGGKVCVKPSKSAHLQVDVVGWYA